MTTWLKLLPLELQEITDFIEPPQKVVRGDNLVGVMSDDLKKLYTLWMLVDKEAEQSKLNYRFTHKPEDEHKALEYGAKTEALRCLFWVCLKEEFDLWSKSISGIREGWQVCWTDESVYRFPFTDLFRGLFEDLE